ncbi:MAG: hypothetical protein ACF8Q5_01600 [Phycisphaerales bacterium JB040]
MGDAIEDSVRAGRVLPIVVGSTLEAERYDRGTAYRLGERLRARAERAGLEVVVCTDVWYLNDAELSRRACVSVGEPGVNALSAHLASRVPSAYVIDGVLMVQFDVEAGRGHACCWGVGARATARAAEAFAERYAAAFVEGAVSGLE